jgi:hypothetical protein
LKDFTTTGGDPLDYLGGYRAIKIVVNPQNEIKSPDHVVMVVAFYLPTTYTAPLTIIDDLPKNWSADPGNSSWDSVVKICYGATLPAGFPNYLPFSTPCSGWATQLSTSSVVQFSYSGGSGGVLTAQIVSGSYGPGWLVMFIKANYDLQGSTLPSGYFTRHGAYCIRDFENYAELLYDGSTLATATGTLRGVGQGVSC